MAFTRIRLLKQGGWMIHGIDSLKLVGSTALTNCPPGTKTRAMQIAVCDKLDKHHIASSSDIRRNTVAAIGTQNRGSLIYAIPYLHKSITTYIKTKTNK